MAPEMRLALAHIFDTSFQPFERRLAGTPPCAGPWVAGLYYAGPWVVDGRRLAATATAISLMFRMN